MKDTGIGVIATGVIAALIGIFMNVGRSAGYGIGEVANLHAMHIQSLAVIGGLIFILTGAVLYAAGTINETIQRGAGTEVVASAPAPEPSEEEDGYRNKGTAILVGAVILLGLIVVGISLAVQSKNAQTPNLNYLDPNSMRAEDNGTLMEPMAPDMNAPMPIGNSM